MNEKDLYNVLGQSYDNTAITSVSEMLGGPNKDEIIWYWARTALTMPSNTPEIETARDVAYHELNRLSHSQLDGSAPWLKEAVLLELMLISIRGKTSTSQGWVINEYMDPEKGLEYLKRLVQINEKWMFLLVANNTHEKLKEWYEMELLKPNHGLYRGLEK